MIIFHTIDFFAPVNIPWHLLYNFIHLFGTFFFYFSPLSSIFVTILIPNWVHLCSSLNDLLSDEMQQQDSRIRRWSARRRNLDPDRRVQTSSLLGVVPKCEKSIAKGRAYPDNHTRSIDSPNYTCIFKPFFFFTDTLHRLFFLFSFFYFFFYFLV